MKAQFSKCQVAYNRGIPCYGGGLMDVKPTYFVRICDEAGTGESKFGIGECAVLPGVSPEYGNAVAYEEKLHELCANVALGRSTDLMEFSSIMNGFESAIQDFSCGCCRTYYDSAFTVGKGSIPVVGFVTVSSPEKTAAEVSALVASGFRTIKLSMADPDIANLFDVVNKIRSQHDCNTVKIRLDANGLLQAHAASGLLKQLPRHSIQSVEQPIAVGQWEQMARLCAESPVPIVLDEELAGIVNPMAMMQLIRAIKPHILCVKPSLCGGFSNAIHWLKMSAQFNLGCWIASAGESSIGLDALCQWAAMLQPRIGQEIDVASHVVNFKVDGGCITRCGQSAPIPGLVWQS